MGQGEVCRGWKYDQVLVFGALGGVRLWFFFFNDTATTEIYTLSLHDALPIWARGVANTAQQLINIERRLEKAGSGVQAAYKSARDRKSTRLNSSH